MLNRDSVTITSENLGDKTVRLEAKIEKRLECTVRGNNKKIEKMKSDMKEQMMFLLYDRIDSYLIDVQQLLRKINLAPDTSISKNFSHEIDRMCKEAIEIHETWRDKN